MLPDEQSHGSSIPRTYSNTRLKYSDDLGFRSPGVQKMLQSKREASVVARLERGKGWKAIWTSSARRRQPEEGRSTPVCLCNG